MYREVVAPARWRGLLECGWTTRTDPDTPPPPYGVLPDGCMDLVWNGTEILVAGPDTTAHPRSSTPGGAAAGLRFAPGALPALLQVPASELRDVRIPLTTALPHLPDAGARIHDGQEPLRVLLALADRLGRAAGTPADPTTRAVAARAAAGHSAAELADSLGWTTRTLHRHSLTAFGYGPAVLRRVLRFRRAVALLQDGEPTAGVAARAGYADQPHLSREVRALAGVSPSVLAGR